MTSADDVINLTYTPDPGQLADYILGYEHQAYQNYRMMFDTAWDRYFVQMKTELSIIAAFVMVLIYSISLPSFPSAWSVLGFWILAPAPFAGLAAWFILKRGAQRTTKHYNEIFARWNIENERFYSPHYEVEIGPQGFRQVTRTDTLELRWARYHLAILQPDNLVLVFHGTVAVIPNAILPITAQDLVDKIHGWSLEQQKVLTPLA
ncbi:hypothetical protein ACRQ1B_08530 [Rhizobium panacihumi]|uniref:hypothetical protein n=1 Tax=Rhizobium panacihumi TaxID=2008450 RepID=UPI003D7B0A10